MSDRPIVLTGFMGSGKSTVGRFLAQQLGCPLIDLDGVVEASAGCKINEIFAAEGEAAFRRLESDCLRQVLQQGRAVIATGGGAVISAENRRLMRSSGIVVNLDASLEQTISRLRGSTHRPLFNGDNPEARLAALLEDRRQFYEDADIRIDTDGKSVEDVAAEILRYVKGLDA